MILASVYICDVVIMNVNENIFIFFFFSSRRRHTRYWRDWSSDVCSSDLILIIAYSRKGYAFVELIPAGIIRSQPFLDVSAKGVQQRIRCQVRILFGRGQIGRASCRERV